MGYRLGFIIGFIVIISAVPVAYSQTLGSHSVGLVLSQTCITLLKASIPTDCPTYEDLLQLDNSKIEWSGNFTTDENGFFHREPAPIKNSWRLYDHTDEWLVFVDPPKGMHDRIKLITIHPNFDTYTMTVDNVIYNYTRIIYHDRYIEKCKDATINADKWRILVPDTIYHMRKGCNPIHTSFNEIEYVPIPLFEHDVSTTQKYKHDKWIESVKTHCIFKFKACT